MKELGWNIIPIASDDQLEYGCNVLNLGNSRIVTVHNKTARQISKCPDFDGTVEVI